MMVETILESSQDFGMSNGALPQWKRELLQRRAARTRPAAAPSPPPPPPPPPPPLPADDDIDEELRYGPGIVKRLKSRYLSLALRDAPRRRPSVLRRATSLEHLLDERPPPAPRHLARAPRPASVAAPPAPRAPAVRRDFVKRARSVDALSRLDSREELGPPSPSPPPPPPAPRPPAPRSARPPRRPAPLLRDAERPPPDVVRSTLRKFESAPARRPAPAARVSAVLRGLEGSRRSVTPELSEPDARSPSPYDAPNEAAPTTPPPPSTPAPPFEFTPPTSPMPAPSSPPFAFPTILTPTLAAGTESEPENGPRSEPTAAAPALSADEPECARPVAAAAEARRVSRAALEGIARAGCTTRYAFEAPRPGSHLPPLAATNAVLVGRGGRRVCVIRPMPASPRPLPDSPPAPEKPEIPAAEPVPPQPTPSERLEAPAEAKSPEPAAPLVNGHSTPEPRAVSRIGAAGIERAWSGSAPAVRRPEAAPAAAEPRAPWLRPGAGRARAPPAPATSVVFNFSNRKEVPDYIENDGLILRASRRNRIKAGEPGVVLLAGAGGGGGGGDSDGDADAEAEPEACGVRFVNDNVLINGRSSMAARTDRDRIARLKLQFDDSLTRTFEYPSETSFSEESPTAPAAAAAPGAAPAAAPVPHDPPADAPATQLADNTHIASAALSRYTPSKTPAAAFTLGVTRHAPPPPSPPPPPSAPTCAASDAEDVGCAAGAGGEDGGDARPCGADAARSWSEARTLATDLLF